MRRRPKYPLNAPVAKPTTLPTINEIPLPTYELLTQLCLEAAYPRRTLGMHAWELQEPKITFTDIVGAHARILEHEKAQKSGKLRKRFVEALDLAAVAELRDRKRKDWLVQYQKDFLTEGWDEDL